MNLRKLQIDHFLQVTHRQVTEHDHVVHAVDKLGTEIPFQSLRSRASSCCRTKHRRRVFWKPNAASFLIASAPALVVIIKITLRKSTFRPKLSVSRPSSINCSSMLNTSGCAFLDFVQQHNGIRTTANLLGQLTALFKPDIARRGTNQSADVVLLHIFAHVDLNQRFLDRQT